MDHLFTKTEEFQIVAPLSDGNYTNVTVFTQTKGLFISGGHGWSLGSQKNSYEIAFTDKGNTVRWQGAGVPITLQSQGSSYYLVTFDRETDRQHVDFKCYVWDGEWKKIPIKLFPKSLAVQNLITFDSGVPVSFESSEFRWSLLAHFWLCIDSGLSYGEVSHSMVETDFVDQFRQSMKK